MMTGEQKAFVILGCAAIIGVCALIITAMIING